MIKKGVFTLILWGSLFGHIFSQDFVDRIEVKGNHRIPKETIQYHFNLFTGQSYKKEDLEQGVKNLWATGFFSDIKVAVSTEDKGSVIFLSVDEYPVIKEILFDIKGKLKKRELLEFLKNKNIDLPRYFVYDPEKNLNIKTEVLEMMRDQGFNQVTMRSEIKPIGRFEANVIFHIQAGPRFRVETIIFEGKPELKKNILLDAFEFNHEHNFFSWIMGRDFFQQARLCDDLDSLRKLYRKHGYAEVQIGEPRIEDCIKRMFFGKAETMKRIIIPVNPGHIFRIGEIYIINNGPIPISQIHPHILFKTGNIFNGRKVDQTAEEIETLYRKNGYFYARVLALETIDSNKARVNITFDIQAGMKVSIRRLFIEGNTLTDDRVIRKVILPFEQTEFQFGLFLDSLEKLDLMGIARIKDQPKVEPHAKEPEQIDVHLNVEEVYKNEWQVSGGYSRYEGIYFSGFVSLVDFFREGEKLDLIIDHGVRYKNHMIELFKPYLFNQFFSIGFNVFDRKIIYPDLFVRRGRGMALRMDKQIREYWWAAVNYKLESVNADLTDLGESDPDEQNLGSIKILLYRNTVNDIFFPTKGMRCLFSFEHAGKEMGSDIHYTKPEVEGAVFFPLPKGHSLGIHLAYRSIRASEDSIIPAWERFYLGGERTIRGYDIYAIGPKDQEGNNIGGERMMVLNAEYIVPMFKSMAAILFLDTGNALSNNEKISLDNLYWSSGMELRMRFFNFPVPLRLIFAYKNRLIKKDDSHFTIRFALGASF